jgi:Lhr-like helicase
VFWALGETHAGITTTFERQGDFMMRVLLALLFVVVCAVVVDAADVPAARVAIEETDALRIEKAGLDVQLAQTQMLVLEKTLANLQWEAAEIKRRLDAAARLRDEEIARVAKKAGVDPVACKPDVEAKTWVFR